MTLSNQDQADTPTITPKSASKKPWVVGVYAILKNEKHFLDRFLRSALEADTVVMVDTGSEDGSFEYLLQLAADLPPGKLIVEQQIIKPWRFDTPRNVAMHLLPTTVDIAVSFDIDEIFTEGWAQCLRDGWQENTKRGRYFYSWSHNEDGSPATTFWYDKIHTRNDFLWRKPVHEILRYSGAEPETQTYFEGFELHHWPDQTKSRGQYLPLLELSVKEEPNDDRNSHYLGREYMFYNMHEKAIAELKRHLSLPSAHWNEERAASMRFIGRSYEALGNAQEALTWFQKATQEAPLSREPWFELTRQAYRTETWEVAFASGLRGLSITERPKSYICDPEAWSHLLEDYVAIASYRIGQIEIAKVYGERAIATAKSQGVNENEIARLKANMEWYIPTAAAANIEIEIEPVNVEEPLLLKPLEWSKEYQPNEKISYNHVTAASALGEFSIEWKGWKEHDSYCLYLDGEYIDSSFDLEDSKSKALEHLQTVFNRLKQTMGIVHKNWHVVPYVPDLGMLKALVQSMGEEGKAFAAKWALGSFKEDYQAMLAVAPQPEKEQENT